LAWRARLYTVWVTGRGVGPGGAGRMMTEWRDSNLNVRPVPRSMRASATDPLSIP